MKSSIFLCVRLIVMKVEADLNRSIQSKPMPKDAMCNIFSPPGFTVLQKPTWMQGGDATTSVLRSNLYNFSPFFFHLLTKALRDEREWKEKREVEGRFALKQTRKQAGKDKAFLSVDFLLKI